MPQNFVGTVKKVVADTPTVCTVTLVLDKSLNFEAGQYVFVQLPKDETKPYSICTPPRQTKEIELCIKKVPGGFASNYMCSLRKGAKLKLLAPMGKFVVNADTKNDVVFLATGTGISSLKGMIAVLLEKGLAQTIWLFLGVKTEEEIIYRQEFEALAKKYRNFIFVPVLSRPEKSWKGAAGHVQDVVLEYVKRPGKTDIYICGVKAMVEECIPFAEAKKFANIYYEKYV